MRADAERRGVQGRTKARFDGEDLPQEKSPAIDASGILRLSQPSGSPGPDGRRGVMNQTPDFR